VRSVWLALFISVSLGALVGCTEQDTTTRSKTKNSQGRSDGKTVVLDSSSTAQGTTIFIPGSASDIDSAALEIEDSPAQVAKQTTAAYLNIPGQVTTASAPVLVTYAHSPTHNQVGSLILTLPLEADSAQLRSSDENLVVFYEIFSEDSDITILGVIPTSDLDITSKTVSFALRGFGIYQAGYLSEAITSEVKANNDGTVIAKNDQSTIVRRKIDTAQNSSGSSSTGSTSGSGSSSSGSDVNLDLVQGWNLISESASEETSGSLGSFKVAISPTGNWLVFARVENGPSRIHVNRISLETKQSTRKTLAVPLQSSIIDNFEVSIDDFGNIAAISSTISLNMTGESIVLATLSASDIRSTVPLPRTAVSSDRYSIFNHQSGGIVVVTSDHMGESDVAGSQGPKICEAYSFNSEGEDLAVVPISQNFEPHVQLLCGGRHLRTATGLILAVPYRDTISINHMALISIGQSSFANPTPVKIADWPLTNESTILNVDNSKVFLTSGADGMPIFALQIPGVGYTPGITAIGGVKSSGQTNLILHPEQLTTANLPIALAPATGGTSYVLESYFWCSIAACTVNDENSYSREITAAHMPDLSTFKLSSFPGGHSLINVVSGAATKRDSATRQWEPVQSIPGYQLEQNSNLNTHAASSPNGLVVVAAKFAESATVAEVEPIKIYVFKP
jgi:hypothetical protein